MRITVPLTAQPGYSSTISDALNFTGVWLASAPSINFTGRKTYGWNTGIDISANASGATYNKPSVAGGVYLIEQAALPTSACTLIVLGSGGPGMPGTGQIGTSGSEISAPFAAARLGLHLPYGPDGAVYWDFGGTGPANRTSAPGLAFSAADIWVFTTGVRGMEIWQNGQLKAANANTPTRTNVTNEYWGIGSNTDWSQQLPTDASQFNGVALMSYQAPQWLCAAMRSHTDFYALAFNNRVINIPIVSAGIVPPTLLAASAVNIGTTYATPRVTFTRP